MHACCGFCMRPDIIEEVDGTSATSHICATLSDMTCMLNNLAQFLKVFVTRKLMALVRAHSGDTLDGHCFHSSGEPSKVCFDFSMTHESTT